MSPNRLRVWHFSAVEVAALAVLDYGPPLMKPATQALLLPSVWMRVSHSMSGRYTLSSSGLHYLDTQSNCSFSVSSSGVLAG
jgi:hypothetical protein